MSHGSSLQPSRPAEKPSAKLVFLFFVFRGDFCQAPSGFYVWAQRRGLGTGEN
jgi:hypothetical protein